MIEDQLEPRPATMTMMGWDELGDLITCGLIVASTILLALVAVCLLVIAVCQMIYVLRRSLRGGAEAPALLSTEEVLERIPDVVPCQEPPRGAGGGVAAADDDDEDDRETCVCAICLAPYEPAGEACGVLPGCGHVFHKLCVAKWLRQNSTCPLCRTAFDVTDTRLAVENMV